MMRLLAILLVMSTPFGVARVQADERILSYDSDIKVNADASIDVTETIVVRAEGSLINRGIYRDFPTHYKDRYGNNVVVDFQMIGVERNGKPEPWFTENLSNGVRINTGGDNYIERPAVHTFNIRYRTTRQIGFFADHDELYWNAIGTDWAFPIDSGSVKVRLPSQVPVDQMRAEGYTGPQGAKGINFRAETPVPGVARWQLASPLRSREGFTIVLSFPKGLIVAPTSTQRVGWFLKDNRGVLIALGGLLALLAFCIQRWRAVGRDPAKGIIIARYEAPEGHTPAGLRYLRRQGYDTRCFSADVLDLAVSGFLRIERKDRWLVKDEWALERTAAPDGTESPSDSQSVLLNALFPGNQARLELEKSNAYKLQSVRNKHSTALDRKYLSTYFNRNGANVAVAAVIAIFSAALAIALSGGGGLLAIIAVCVVMVVIVLVFGFLVYAYTPEGRRLVDEIEGFRLYLSVAERDELKSMAGPDVPPTLDAKRYEKLLPYAVALDVEDAWTRKFTEVAGAAAAEQATSSIGWYSGGSIGSLGSLSQAVGSSLSSSIASASSPPGSSSGGGGGGSSGGGGGGGGGGGR